MPPPDAPLSVLCLNGPNLDRLGRRDPEVYGSTTLAELEEKMTRWGAEMNIEVRFLQSSHEGDLVDAIHDAEDLDGIVVNPGALTHTSAALHDAVGGSSVPVVEVHISNIRARDRWRRRSLLAPVAAASIFGRGVIGYRSALSILYSRRRWPVESIRYGPHPDQVIDLRRADAGSGAALLVHGGFWRDVWGRDTVEGWAVDLADHGISTAAIEYRRLASGGGGVATVSDVVEAASAAASTFAGTPLAIVGHSAGAHLAVMAATRHLFPLQGLVGVSGIYDLDTPKAPDLGGGAVANFLASGGSSAPTTMPPSLPVVLLHGADDAVVPPSQSAAYARELTSSGSSVVHQEAVATGHFEFLDTRSTAWEDTRRQVGRLLGT